MVFPPPHCIRFMFASTKSSGILIGPFISLSALSLTVRSHRINILPRTPFTAHSPECSAQSRCINYLIWKGKASPRQALSLMKDKKKIAGPRPQAQSFGSWSRLLPWSTCVTWYLPHYFKAQLPCENQSNWHPIYSRGFVYGRGRRCPFLQTSLSLLGTDIQRSLSSFWCTIFLWLSSQLCGWMWQSISVFCTWSQL